MQIFNCEVTKDSEGKLWVALPDWHGYTITGKPISEIGRCALVAKPGDDEYAIRRRIRDKLPKQYGALWDTHNGRQACRELARQVHAMLDGD